MPIMMKLLVGDIWNVWRSIKIYYILLIIIIVLVNSLSNVAAYAEQTYSGIDAAPVIDENKMIPTGAVSYRVTGYYGEMNARLVKVFLSNSIGGKSYIYNMVNPAFNANNGYLLIDETDVEAFIAYFGQSSNSTYISHVKSQLSDKLITLEDSFGYYTFYSYAEVAEAAGGASGSISYVNQGTSPATYELRLDNNITYDVGAHSVSMDLPAKASKGVPIDITLHTTEGSHFVTRHQTWSLSITGPGGTTTPLNYAHEYLSGKSHSKTITHTFTQAGTYTLVFAIEDASYHNNSRTGTNLYSVTKSITITDEADPSITTSGTADPSTIEYTGGTINVTVTAKGTMSNYSDAANIKEWRLYAKKKGASDTTRTSQTVPGNTFSSQEASFPFTIPANQVTSDSFTQDYEIQAVAYYHSPITTPSGTVTSTLGNRTIVSTTVYKDEPPPPENDVDFTILPSPTLTYRSSFTVRPHIELDDACTYNRHEVIIERQGKTYTRTMLGQRTDTNYTFPYHSVIGVGTHQVSLKVYSSCGEELTGPKPLTLTESGSNGPPSARAGFFLAGSYGTEPLDYVVKGTPVDLRLIVDYESMPPSPYDPDGDPILFMGWQASGSSPWLGELIDHQGYDPDDTTWENIQTSVTGQHTFQFKLQDPQGAVGYAWASLGVYDPNPQPRISGPSQIKQGRPVTFSSENSFSPVQGRTIDHSRDTWTNVKPSYPNPGTEIITLEVYDNTGLRSLQPATHTLEVLADQPPIADIHLLSPGIREQLVRISNESYSPDYDELTTQRLSFRYDRDNDGSFDDEVSNLLTATMVDTYYYYPTEVGHYEFKIQVTEDYGLSATDAVTLEILNREPIFSFSASSTTDLDVVIPQTPISASHIDSSWSLVSNYSDVTDIPQWGVVPGKNYLARTKDSGVSSRQKGFRPPISEATTQHFYQTGYDQYRDQYHHTIYGKDYFIKDGYICSMEDQWKNYEISSKCTRIPGYWTNYQVGYPGWTGVYFDQSQLHQIKSQIEFFSRSQLFNNTPSLQKIATVPKDSYSYNLSAYDAYFASQDSITYEIPSSTVPYNLRHGGYHHAIATNGEYYTLTTPNYDEDPVKREIKKYDRYGSLVWTKQENIFDNHYWSTGTLVLTRSELVLSVDETQMAYLSHSDSYNHTGNIRIINTSNGSLVRNIVLTHNPRAIIGHEGMMITVNNDFATELHAYDFNGNRLWTANLEVGLGNFDADGSSHTGTPSYIITSDDYLITASWTKVVILDLRTGQVAQTINSMYETNAMNHFTSWYSSEYRFTSYYYSTGSIRVIDDGHLVVTTHLPLESGGTHSWAWSILGIPNLSRSNDQHSMKLSNDLDLSDIELGYTFWSKELYGGSQGLGMGFRVQDKNNMYKLNTNQDVIQLIKVVNGVETVLAETANNYHIYSYDNPVVIRANGDQLTVYDYGVPILSATDSTFTHGGLALYSDYPLAAFRDVYYADLNAGGASLTTQNSAVVGEPIELHIQYEDPESDPMADGFSQWTYLHENPTKFLDAGDGRSGTSAYHGQTISSPEPLLDMVGLYKITGRVKDDPQSAYPDPSLVFDSYRRASNAYSEYVVIHRRPIADFTLSANEDGTFAWDDHSYDPDRWLTPTHYSTEATGIDYAATRGILERRYYYLTPSGATVYEKLVTPEETGSYKVGMSVKDEYGVWSEYAVQSFHALVAVAPDAPPAAGFTVSPVTAYRGSVISVASTASDAEDGSRANLPHEYYIANMTNGSTEKLVSTVRTTWTHPFTELGVYRLRQIVSDKYGQTDQASAEITIVNRAPSTELVNPASSQAANPTMFTEATPTLNWSYSDLDGDPETRYELRIYRQSDDALLYSSGVVISNSLSQTISGLPDETVLRAVLRVHDGYTWSSWSASKYFHIVLNRAPAAAFHWTPTPVWEGDLVQLVNTSSDPDGDDLTFQWSIRRADGTVSTSTVEQPAYRFTTPGQVEITLVVSDGSLSASVTHQVEVRPLVLLPAVYHTNLWLDYHVAQEHETATNPKDFYAGELLLLQAVTSPTTVNHVDAWLSATTLQGEPLYTSVRLTATDGLPTLHTGELYDERWISLTDGLPPDTYQVSFRVTYGNGTVKNAIVPIRIFGNALSTTGVHRLR